MNERCLQLQSESAQLRSNLAGMTKQYNQLTLDYKAIRDLNFDKGKYILAPVKSYLKSYLDVS